MPRSGEPIARAGGEATFDAQLFEWLSGNLITALHRGYKRKLEQVDTTLALDGVILPYNDKRWGEIYPPNGWGCRCTVVPRMEFEVEGKVNIEEMR